MKKLLYISLCCLIASACQKEQLPATKEEVQEIQSDFAVNFYQPSTDDAGASLQVTDKNEAIQLSALGSSVSGKYAAISSLYISDMNSKSEWVVLVDNGSPSAMYRVNTETQVKSPGLYTFEAKGDRQVLRYYEYDWTKKLGLLRYEAMIDQGAAKVLFENKAPTPIASATKSATRVKRKKAKSTVAFPAPVLALNKHALALVQRKAISAQVNYAVQLESLIKASQALIFEDLAKLAGSVADPNAEALNTVRDQLSSYLSPGILDGLSQVFNKQQQSATRSNFTVQAANKQIQASFFPTAEQALTDPNTYSLHFNALNSGAANRSAQIFLSSILALTTGTQSLAAAAEPGSGFLQVSFTWDTNDTDLDLHVTDPAGEEIYYSNTCSLSGGYLDRDHTDGFGPENIIWDANAPDGEYRVSIVYYKGEPVTQATVTITNGLGVEKSYPLTVEFNEQAMVPVVTFTKSGDNLIFP
jgi:hypothetical protein